jgi:hypothetical protein
VRLFELLFILLDGEADIQAERGSPQWH